MVLVHRLPFEWHVLNVMSIRVNLQFVVVQYILIMLLHMNNRDDLNLNHRQLRPINCVRFHRAAEKQKSRSENEKLFVIGMEKVMKKKMMIMAQNTYSC